MQSISAQHHGSLHPPHVSTPDSHRKSVALTPEHALASSPLLCSREQTPQRSSRDRFSTASSFRLSKDLDSIRWDGSSVNEDDSMFREREEEKEGKGYQAGSESDGESTQQTPEQARPEEALTYSALSKRADLILANAKRKLSLLEGNLGRARHSLVVTPQTIAELNRSDSTPSTQSAPFGFNDDYDDDPSSPLRGPRINFGTPRIGLSPALRGTAARGSPGHSRVYSDTSIPVKGAPSMTGGRSFDYTRHRDFGTKHPLHKSSQDLRDGLGSVPEDVVTPAVTETQGERVDEGGRHGDSGSEKASDNSSSRELRNQADELRNRIAQLQEVSRADSQRRQSQRLSLNGEIALEVNMLQNRLEAQEEAIARAEGSDESDSNGRVSQRESDSRAEWHRVFAESKRRGSMTGSYIDEDDYDDLAYDEEVLNGGLVNEEEATTDGPHEERNDAFDYEHFILHSIMGNPVRRNSSSVESEGSRASTERGIDDVHEEAEEEGEEDDWEGMRQGNESKQSFFTAHSNGDESEADSDGYATDRQGSAAIRDSLKKWPLPPSARNSSSSKGTMPRTPPRASRHVESEGMQAEERRRPESLIVSTLTGPTSTSPEKSLHVEDRELFYAVAQSFREVCMRLQHGDLGPHDGVDLRQRLEVARRVLDGDL